MQFSTAEEAVKVINSGDHVFIQSVAAAPQQLIRAMTQRAVELRGVKIFHLHTEGAAPYALPEYAASFHTNALFIGANVRLAVEAGEADYIPVFLSEVPSLFRKGVIPLNMALIQVSPPDRHGFCSLGVSVDVSHAAVEMATHVIAQINPNMPRTHGDGLIHVSKINVAVEVDDALPEKPLNILSEDERAIEVDLTGQVCADSISARLYSGVGGQMGFIRGASLSEGGKPIIALPSVTGRRESRIVSFLKPGAGVVTTRAHIHYVVTEYGSVNLYGKNLRDRAQALIALAHPQHRERLEREAYERFKKFDC